MDASLRQRIRSAGIYLPLVTLCIWLGPWSFAALLAVAAILGGRELSSLLSKLGWKAPPFLPLAALVIFAASLSGVLGAARLPLTALAWLVGFVWLFVPWVPARAGTGPESWISHLIGALYLGLLLAYWARLEGGPWRLEGQPDSAGPRWATYALVLILLCDTGAYVVGRLWGRTKLWVAVSPKKTWEGAAGGLAAAAAAGGLMAPWMVPGLSWTEGVLLGASVGLLAPFGDLIESRLKRKAMVKDAGGIFPGHGGMLDRLDSILFVAPLFFYGLSFLAR